MSLVQRTNETWLPTILDDMFKTDWLGGTTNARNLSARIPAVNIMEKEDRFLLEVAAPGKNKEDFNIELDNEVLTISSEEKKETEQSDDQARFMRKEFNYSNFKRAFSLPDSVNASGIAASYENGVLIVTLPKKEEAKVQPKRLIEIA